VQPGRPSRIAMAVADEGAILRRIHAVFPVVLTRVLL
jgi:hypothetical protein